MANEAPTSASNPTTRMPLLPSHQLPLTSSSLTPPPPPSSIPSQVDDDGTGSLSAEELCAALRTAKIPFREDAIREMVALMDWDKVGACGGRGPQTVNLKHYPKHYPEH